MREILFRGKQIDNGEWIEGHYIFVQDAVSKEFYHCIVKSGGEICVSELWDYEFIDKDTLSTFTGLTDKNGRKIFEGDIIKIVPDYDYSDDYSISKVYSYNGVFCVDYHGDDFDSTALGFLEDYLPDGDFEVIGNIHDNPEMLEVTK